MNRSSQQVRLSTAPVRSGRKRTAGSCLKRCTSLSAKPPLPTVATKHFPPDAPRSTAKICLVPFFPGEFLAERISLSTPWTVTLALRSRSGVRFGRLLAPPVRTRDSRLKQEQAALDGAKFEADECFSTGAHHSASMNMNAFNGQLRFSHHCASQSAINTRHGLSVLIVQ